MTNIENNYNSLKAAYLENKVKISQGKFVFIRNGVETVIYGFCQLADGNVYLMKTAEERILLLPTDVLIIKD